MIIKMEYYIRDFGAVGDGITKNTKAIQAAIDACAENGGGKVIVDLGVYMTGTIILHSNIDFHIEGNAVLLGSPDCSDYPEQQNLVHVDSEKLPRHRNACLIFAEECENITLSGMGKIDCNGHLFIREKKENTGGWRYERIDAPTPPRVVFFAGCRNVRVTDLSMQNQPAGWSYFFHDCDFVTCDHLKITSNVQYPNNDGIDVNVCRNVTISNCIINCGDDCIAIRANNLSLPENKVCERVTITNCNFTSYACGIRIGWLNDGVIRNCVFSNIVMTDTNSGITLQLPSHPEDIVWADEGREATLIENLSFQNVMMDGIYASPIRILIGQSEHVTHVTGIRNINFDSIRSRGLEFPIFCGRKSNFIENITLNNCCFERVGDEVLPDYRFHGPACWDRPLHNRIFSYVKNVSMNNTVFTANDE